VAVAKPSPEMPPVTTAEIPAISNFGLLAYSVVNANGLSLGGH